MNRKLFKAMSLLLVLATAFPVFAACKGDDKDSSSTSDSSQPSQGLDNEKDILVFSSGEFDGVFNPFFSTSAYDSGVVGQTQIGMISADETGNNVVFGKEPYKYQYDGRLQPDRQCHRRTCQWYTENGGHLSGTALHRF